MPALSVSCRTIQMSAAFCRSRCLQPLTGHGLRCHATEIAYFSNPVLRNYSRRVKFSRYSHHRLARRSAPSNIHDAVHPVPTSRVVLRNNRRCAFSRTSRQPIRRSTARLQLSIRDASHRGPISQGRVRPPPSGDGSLASGRLDVFFGGSGTPGPRRSGSPCPVALDTGVGLHTQESLNWPLAVIARLCDARSR